MYVPFYLYFLDTFQCDTFVLELECPMVDCDKILSGVLILPRCVYVIIEKALYQILLSIMYEYL